MTTVQSTVTFSSDQNNEVSFTITKDQANESTLFTTMLVNSTNVNFRLPVLEHVNGINKKFTINTVDLLRYVHEYFMIWGDQIKECNYLKTKTIQTGDIHQVLHEKDIEFFTKYLKNNVRTYNNLNVHKYNQELSYKRSIDIELLNKLLHQVDDYLGIESLSNKIYAWIAVLIWNTNILDYVNAVKEIGYDIPDNLDEVNNGSAAAAAKKSVIGLV